MAAKRVLLIDDADDIRAVAKMCLEVFGGWEVLTASTGADGIAMAHSEAPDVILLDVRMPGLDGPDTLRTLQASSPTRNTPVVFLTANVERSERERLTQLGAHGVLTKPFDALHLADDLDAVLSGPS
jgi:CheY-like chemotaxis protein